MLSSPRFLFLCRLASVRATSNPWTSSLTTTVTRVGCRIMDTSAILARACLCTFVRASWVMRNRTPSMFPGSRRSCPTTLNRVDKPLRSPYSLMNLSRLEVTQDLAGRPEKLDLVLEVTPAGDQRVVIELGSLDPELRLQDVAIGALNLGRRELPDVVQQVFLDDPRLLGPLAGVFEGGFEVSRLLLGGLQLGLDLLQPPAHRLVHKHERIEDLVRSLDRTHIEKESLGNTGTAVGGPYDITEIREFRLSSRAR